MKKVLGDFSSYQFIKNVLSHMEIDSLESLTKERYNVEYEAFKFSVQNTTYRSRLAKQTPKKKGYFVAIWHKNKDNVNIPFHFEIMQDFLVINILDENHKGQFIFPKELLRHKGIITSNSHKGKMAFRVYPSWERNLNKSASQTQKWQKQYFIDMSEEMDCVKLKNLYFNKF